MDNSLGFLVERNEDNTLSVWFSDEHFFDGVDIEDIDDAVFGYKPEMDKIQAFTETQLYALSAKADQCH